MHMHMKNKKLVLRKEIKDLHKSITMKCLECSCFQIKDTLLCDVPRCPLWEIRPTKAEGLYTLIKQYRQKNLSSSQANK